MIKAGTLLFVVSMVACTKTVVLREPKPILVSAKTPEPPPPPPEPPRVEVKQEKIQVNDKIHFEYNQAVIRTESFGLLAEIAKVINEHPELVKIRVEGHTDNVGSKKFNLDLSKRRAQAVRDHLVMQGKVADARLDLDGYGFDKPIDTNDSETGRAMNRRVEFTIVERSDETAAGTKQGGVP